MRRVISGIVVSSAIVLTLGALGFAGQSKPQDAEKKRQQDKCVTDCGITYISCIKPCPPINGEQCHQDCQKEQQACRNSCLKK